MYIFIRVCIYTCIHIYICIYIRIRIYNILIINIWVWCACLYVWLHVNFCVFVCVCMSLPPSLSVCMCVSAGVSKFNWSEWAFRLLSSCVLTSWWALTVHRRRIEFADHDGPSSIVTPFIPTVQSTTLWATETTTEAVPRYHDRICLRTHAWMPMRGSAFNRNKVSTLILTWKVAIIKVNLGYRPYRGVTVVLPLQCKKTTTLTSWPRTLVVAHW